MTNDGGVDWIVDPVGETQPELSLTPAPGMVDAFRFAALADDVDGDGQPVFSTERARIPAGEHRDRLLTYLSRGTSFYRSDYDGIDHLDPTRSVPVGYRTDGEWIWPYASAHYLRVHGIGPVPGLAERIARRRYWCTPISIMTVLEARAALLKRTMLMRQWARQ